MGMHLNGARAGREPCLLFEDCGVLSVERMAMGIACADFASPRCAASGVMSLRARLAVRQAAERVHERLREPQAAGPHKN